MIDFCYDYANIECLEEFKLETNLVYCVPFVPIYFYNFVQECEDCSAVSFICDEKIPDI